MTILNLATGWLLFLSLSLAGGVVASRWIILAGDGEPRRAAARIGSRATIGIALALVLVFVRQLLEFRDPYATWSEDAQLLLGLPWGRSWKAALSIAMATIPMFMFARRGRAAAWGIATIGVLALGGFPALTGHANAGDARWLTVLADTLHVWAVGGWIGGLAVVLLLDRSARRGGGEGLLVELVPRFSPFAMVCVGALLLTGTVGSWVHLDDPGALLSTSYGRLLLLKLGLVAIVLLLGAINYRRLTPRLGHPGGDEAMRRSATREFLVANVVLIVTAALVRTSPM